MNNRALHQRTRWVRRGFIPLPPGRPSWWKSHAMAPAPILLSEQLSIIRIYVGSWDANGVSRIGFVDIDLTKNMRVINISGDPVVDIGPPGSFYDNGVFPGHARRDEAGNIWLYTTGFQLTSHPDVDHLSFGGLAIGRISQEVLRPISHAPILDRSDEGLHVRSGISAEMFDSKFYCVYSAGTGFEIVGGKLRPQYSVYLQESPDGIEFGPVGREIVSTDHTVEHGLGRPQIQSWDGQWYIFYTRRMRDMKYQMGCATSTDLMNWQRIDEWLNIGHGAHGEHDSEFVYFPSVLEVGSRRLLFYSGNGFGRSGIGVCELIPSVP